jgi:hypothetical protein
MFRRIVKLALSVMVVVAFAAPAIAGGGNGGNFARPLTNSDNSVEFRQGTWRFDRWAPGSPPYGFNVYGYLKDTQSDGDHVYLKGKVDGYDWGPSVENHNGEAGGSVYVSKKYFGSDPPSRGRIQVCRSRSGLIPNICNESDRKYSAD